MEFQIQPTKRERFAGERERHAERLQQQYGLTLFRCVPQQGNRGAGEVVGYYFSAVAPEVVRALFAAVVERWGNSLPTRDLDG